MNCQCILTLMNDALMYSEPDLLLCGSGTRYTSSVNEHAVREKEVG